MLNLLLILSQLRSEPRPPKLFNPPSHKELLVKLQPTPDKAGATQRQQKASPDAGQEVLLRPEGSGSLYWYLSP